MNTKKIVKLAALLRSPSRTRARLAKRKCSGNMFSTLQNNLESAPPMSGSNLAVLARSGGGLAFGDLAMREEVGYRQKDLDRFWKYVNKTETCWLWTGGHWNSSSKRKYPTFSVAGKTRLAHRWSFQFFKGPIPDGLTIDHLCRVTFCVNPDHLEAVTILENVLRGTRLKTHCVRGHSLMDKANLLKCIGKRARWRRCRTCTREDLRKYYRQRKNRG